MFNANVTVVDNLASTDSGRYTDPLDSLNCDNWSLAMSNGNTTFGATVVPAGLSQAVCTSTHVLACCSTPFSEKLKGFTTAATTGIVNGRAAMHALCGAQFPGGHMCHAAEYQRATPATPRRRGRCVDRLRSGYLRTAGGTQVENGVGSIHMGRYLGPLDSLNCDNWSLAMSNGNTTFGGLITATGMSQAACTSSHPIACCQ